MWLERDAHEAPRRRSSRAPATASCASRPAARRSDPRGRRWSLDGPARGPRRTRRRTGVLLTPDYPDALARVWSALTCPTSGEVLLSAAPGLEFIDWGRQAHVGGGSHGSLHASDSLGALLFSGRRVAASREPGAVGHPRRRGARAGALRRVAIRGRVSIERRHVRRLLAAQCSAPCSRCGLPAGRRRAPGSLTAQHRVAGNRRSRSRCSSTPLPGRTLVAPPAGAGDRERRIAEGAARAAPRAIHGLLRRRLHEGPACAGR